MTAAERAYRHTISIHCPNRDEMELAVRCDLATIRDQATAGVSRASVEAAGLLAEVSRLATHAVYAEMDTGRLLRLRLALMMTVEAAREIERVSRA